MVGFRKKYRQTDVLLIDDIQFLAGKERIQEEFFHTFNALHESHKQIVLTCDRPASEIQGLENRLVSRFEWGLVTDLQPPDIEMRLAILKKKAQMMNVVLPEDIINFLATRIRTNIRRLEGALIRVASYASLTGKKLTIEVVENLLREILHEEGRQTISIEVIQKRVAEHFDIRLADMTSKRRPENIAFPRQIAMYLSRQMTESSLNTIGEAFGGRDHGTVLHACRLVKDRMEVDSNVRQVVHYLEKQLNGKGWRLGLHFAASYASHRGQPSHQSVSHLQKASGLWRRGQRAVSSAVRADFGRQRRQFRHRAGRTGRLPGPERGGQNHDAENAGGPALSDQRHAPSAGPHAVGTP